MKITLKNIDKTSALATILKIFSPLGEIFGDKMPYYVISDFEVIESLLKTLISIRENSRKETV